MYTFWLCLLLWPSVSLNVPSGGYIAVREHDAEEEDGDHQTDDTEDDVERPVQDL